MSLHEFWRNKRKPLGKTDILVTIGLEDFEEAEGRVPSVFDIVAIGGRDIADVTSLGLTGALVYCEVANEVAYTW